MVLLRLRSERLTAFIFQHRMVELVLEEGKRLQYRNERLYSKLIGKKILARIVKNIGYEVLYEFGFTNAIIERMIKR